MRYEYDLHDRRMIEEDYEFYNMEPEKKHGFNLIKTFQRGFSLSSLIGAVIYILRYFAR